MAVYIYKAKITPSELKIGTIEAENERAAINKLMQLNYHPISIRIKSEGDKKKYFLLKKINQKDIYVLMRQLSNLIQAGLPLVKALHNISNQNTNAKLRLITLELKEKIQKGMSFSESLKDYPHIFSVFEINMIKSAEKSGILAEIIAKLADLKEKELIFKSRIKSALAYPTLLLIVGILTLFVLTTFVLPKFISLFQDIGQRLPLITQWLIAWSLFLKNYWSMIFIVLIILGFLFKRYLKTESGKLWFAKLTLKLPIARQIITQIQTSRFCRSLGTLLENGVPILDSLQITAELLNNKVFAQEIKYAQTQVAKGKHISNALADGKIFDKNTLDLIAVGEESGRLEDMLIRIAQMNEHESAQRIETLVSLLEPALILCLGFIVAFIVMAILLPIFQMNFLVQ
ncbi:MAG: type II secretion system F family protein [Gammaproteobacteria bacterium]|nr:type II secretion system F family protein [Gammaproteobacteria bacterium]